MLSTDEEYRGLIAELHSINKQMVDGARALPTSKGALPLRWVTELDDVIEKHRKATKRLRELVLRRQPE